MRPEPGFFWFSLEKALLIVFSGIDASGARSTAWARDDLAHAVLTTGTQSETIAFEAIGDLGVVLIPLTRPLLATAFDVQLTVHTVAGEKFEFKKRFADANAARDLNEMSRGAAAIRVGLIASMPDGRNQALYSLGEYRNGGVQPLASAVDEAIAAETARMAPERLAVHTAILSPRAAGGLLGPAVFHAPPALEVTIEAITASRALDGTLMSRGMRFFKDLEFSLSLRVLTPNAFFRFGSTQLLRFTPGTHGPIALSAPGQELEVAEPERERAIGAAIANDVVITNRKLPRPTASPSGKSSASDTITWWGAIYYNDHFYFDGLPPGTRFVDRSALIERVNHASSPSDKPMMLVFTDHRRWVGFSLDSSGFSTATKLARFQEAIFRRAQAAYSAEVTELPEVPDDVVRLAPFDAILPRDLPGVAARRFLDRLARWIAARRIAAGHRNLDLAKLQLRIATFGAAMSPHRSIGGAAVRLDHGGSTGPDSPTSLAAPDRWAIVQEIAMLAARDVAAADWLRATPESHALGLAAIIWQAIPDVAAILVDGVMRHRFLLDGPHIDFARLARLIEFFDGVTFDPMGAPPDVFKSRLKSYLLAVMRPDADTFTNIAGRIDALDQPLDGRALPPPLGIADGLTAFEILSRRLETWRSVARDLRARLDANPPLRALSVPFDAVPSERLPTAQPGNAFSAGNRVDLLWRLAERETGDLHEALAWLFEQVRAFDRMAFEKATALETGGFSAPRVVAATQPAGETVGQHAARLQLNWILDDALPSELEVYARRADDVFLALRGAGHQAKLAVMDSLATKAREWWRDGVASAASFSTVRVVGNAVVEERIGRALAISALHAALLRRINALDTRLQAELDDLERGGQKDSHEYQTKRDAAESVLETRNALRQVAGISRFDFVQYWVAIDALSMSMNITGQLFQ